MKGRFAVCAAALGMLPLAAVGAEGDLARMSWLAGCWTTASAEPGTGEHWTTPAGGTMLGTSRTIRGGKTRDFEFMQLRLLDDGRLAFIAQPAGVPPTTFPLKSMTADQAVFENLAHDFPQRVIYARTAEGNLRARIEGTLDGQSRGMDYPMNRVDCTRYFALR